MKKLENYKLKQIFKKIKAVYKNGLKRIKIW